MNKVIYALSWFCCSIILLGCPGKKSDKDPIPLEDTDFATKFVGDYTSTSETYFDNSGHQIASKPASPPYSFINYSVRFDKVDKNLLTMKVWRNRTQVNKDKSIYTPDQFPETYINGRPFSEFRFDLSYEILINGGINKKVFISCEMLKNIYEIGEGIVITSNIQLDANEAVNEKYIIKKAK